MNTVRRLLLAGATASFIALGGCAVVDLSRLNNTYETLLVRQSTLPRPASDASDLGPETQREDVEAGFRIVGNEALKAEKEIREPATKVTAYRLAAVSLWLGGDEKESEIARDAGLNVCKSLTGQSIGAPRDCAILAYLGLLRDQKKLHDKQAPLLKAPRTPENLREMFNVVVGLEALGKLQLDVLPSITTGLQPYKGISPTSQRYFQRVAAASACMLSTGDFWARNAPNIPEKADVIAKTTAVARSPYGPLLHAAGQIPSPDFDWFSSVQCL